MSTTPNKQEIIATIVKLAIEKPEFKEKLLKSPKEAVEALINTKLPENFELVVHEDSPTKINIVLPNTSDELSEVELLAVSGGCCGWNTIEAFAQSCENNV